MPHGTPDWGLVGPKQTTYGMDDEGEAAVRLGSPHFFDRRGDVLHLTDFGEGIGPWQPELSGLNSAVTLETEHSRQGPYAIGLQAGDDDEEFAQIVQHMAYPVVSLIGLEFTFNLDEDTSEVYGNVTWFDGVNRNHATIAYQHTTGQLFYLSLAGVYTWFATPGVQRELVRASHTLKMVVDITTDPVTLTGEYVRVILNDTPYLLRGISTRPILDNTAPTMYVAIQHHGPGTIHPKIYVDNAIVTQNEPPYQG